MHVGLWRARGKYQRLPSETAEGDGRPWFDYALPGNVKQLLQAYQRVLS